MMGNVITIDIVNDIIKAFYVGGRYKGEEVNKILCNIISNLAPYSILVIDLQNANPLDYVFCQYAFGPVINEVQNNNKPTLFKMQPIHKRCFYRGILKHIDKSLPRNSSIEESEKVFKDSGYFTMITSDKQDKIEFIGNLNTTDTSILKFINELTSVSGREIINSKNEYHSDVIVESLKSLNRKGFILTTNNDEDRYYSIYEILKLK